MRGNVSRNPTIQDYFLAFGVYCKIMRLVLFTNVNLVENKQDSYV